MKLIKILIAFVVISLTIGTVSAFDLEGGTITENSFGDESLENVACAHPAPLDDMRAGYFHSGDFPRAQTDDFGYLHSGAKSNTAGHGNMKKAYD